MPEHHLNIVAFTVPYPANYGGVIDVYYKLLALKAMDIKIHLHCFTYDREPEQALLDCCETVHYYRRKTGFISQLSWKPYIVQSRKSDELLWNLLSNDYPILFEGLHSCYYIDHQLLRQRLLVYRESNIEHKYYYNLFLSERNKLSKFYFLAESIRLYFYQRILKSASAMLAVSEMDTDYLKLRFPGKRVEFLPSFHGHADCSGIPGKGEYALYHGNLSVPENYVAAEYLINKVFPGSGVSLVIAGLKPPDHLREMCQARGIALVPNPSEDELSTLIRNAHVNILLTFQATGLKLKLLNTLYQGRFVLVNKAMLSGTGLDSLCFRADSAEEIRNAVNDLFTREFDQEMIEARQEFLSKNFSDQANAAKIVTMLFPG